MLILFAITKTPFSWNFYLLSNTFLSMSLLHSKISKFACFFQISMWYCSLTFTIFSFLRSNQKYNITPVPSNTTYDILTLPKYTVKIANKILLCKENSPSLIIADSLPPLLPYPIWSVLPLNPTYTSSIHWPWPIDNSHTPHIKSYTCFPLLRSLIV